jgi:hypothetical protein
MPLKFIHAAQFTAEAQRTLRSLRLGGELNCYLYSASYETRQNFLSFLPFLPFLFLKPFTHRTVIYFGLFMKHALFASKNLTSVTLKVFLAACT